MAFQERPAAGHEARGTHRLCLLLLAVLLGLGAGCASTAKRTPADRQFAFEKDGFAYANELLWEYQFDPVTGETTTREREPKPDYHHFCFVMARAARQFHDFARFAPDEPQADIVTYRQLVETVLARDPRSDPARRGVVVIPGYANLREFSRDHEALLKAACGGSWQSFVQRGHWRLVFPFSARHQAGMAARLQRELARGVAPVIHLVRFPQLTINHAVVVYDAETTAEGVRFPCYDPNHPDEPLVLVFREADRRFHLPRTNYFPGGRVDVYEVYRNWLY